MIENSYPKALDTETSVILTVREQFLDRAFDHTATPVGLGGRARATVGINTDNIPAAAVRARSMFRGHAVTLSNGTRTTDVNAVGA